MGIHLGKTAAKPCEGDSVACIVVLKKMTSICALIVYTTGVLHSGKFSTNLKIWFSFELFVFVFKKPVTKNHAMSTTMHNAMFSNYVELQCLFLN